MDPSTSIRRSIEVTGHSALWLGTTSSFISTVECPSLSAGRSAARMSMQPSPPQVFLSQRPQIVAQTTAHVDLQNAAALGTELVQEPLLHWAEAGVEPRDLPGL